MSRQRSVGFPAIFEKKNLGKELWVRVVGHELPWSRDARIPHIRCLVSQILTSPPQKGEPFNHMIQYEYTL